ncbi:hypothetical protein ACWT_5601 [Actinoplanes sp. SE50]|uniref:hypothetical protein n=1 Tax=unclassified Actinoplanes TaxID=2626549 RepID=UPI00023ECF20|nr:MULTISPECIES: hypothetical protein [unclassified Actinoplanes]AEV86618.1 hypothetical protein ACPL_5731 [Actinoplanes sp. SE50/110]ATO85016.1 hypothetical protein ACWT_5601 [Actinoplanes sp. SE50]SLM02425.1 hypothetical protein ACSP50_5674 [Actinoplanes sp. SE50/110]
MITVAAGSTLTLRCPDMETIPLVCLAQVRAPFIADLPPLPVLSLDEPGVRRYGILELVSSAGVAWVEAELRGGLITVLGDSPTGVVQRRDSPRIAGTYPAFGTAQVDTGPGQRLIALSGHVRDVSTSGLLLRATAGDDSPHLPTAILRTLLHVTMPWGEMTASVTTVDQRADQLRGTFDWIDPGDAKALAAFVGARR